jgi:hypothetical protein
MLSDEYESKAKEQEEEHEPNLALAVHVSGQRTKGAIQSLSPDLRQGEQPN